MSEPKAFLGIGAAVWAVGALAHVVSGARPLMAFEFLGFCIAAVGPVGVMLLSAPPGRYVTVQPRPPRALFAAGIGLGAALVAGGIAVVVARLAFAPDVLSGGLVLLAVTIGASLALESVAPLGTRTSGAESESP